MQKNKKIFIAVLFVACSLFALTQILSGPGYQKPTPAQIDEYEAMAEEKNKPDEYSHSIQDIIQMHQGPKADLIDALNKLAIDHNYKGLSDTGIFSFLYDAMKGGTLESGLNQIFWTGINDREKNLDDQWKLAQIVDGYGIYRIDKFDYNNSELLQLSIAIPTSKNAMPMIGQKLKYEFLVFKGNLDAKSVLGAQTVIQLFEPIRTDDKLF